jgi:uncharacterized protein
MSTATLTDNATTVGKVYEAFGRRDINYILNTVADNCTWIGTGEGTLPQGGTYKGKEVVNFFKQLAEHEEFNSFNPISINNINDDEVVAFGNMTVTSKASGNKATSDWVMHWKFNEDGKAVYFHDFFDTAAAYLAEQNLTLKEQSIQTVKVAFDDFLKGDIQAILDGCTDDIEWGAHYNPTVPYGKTYEGKAGAAEFFKTLSESVNYTRFEPKEYYADGDKVFVRGYHQAVVKSTGKTFGHNFLMEFTIRGGKVSRFFAYVDTNDQAKAFQS